MSIGDLLRYKRELVARGELIEINEDGCTRFKLTDFGRAEAARRQGPAHAPG